MLQYKWNTLLVDQCSYLSSCQENTPDNVQNKSTLYQEREREREREGEKEREKERINEPLLSTCMYPNVLLYTFVLCLVPVSVSHINL